MVCHQQELIWFDKGDAPPSGPERLSYLHQDNPNSPYHGFVGNAKAVRQCVRVDFNSLGKYNHDTSDLNLAFIGSAGCGKTDLAKRRHAKANGLPLVEISPRAVRTTHEIFMEIARVCEKSKIPLIEVGRYDNYVIPPINLFIDEVHALPPNLIQGLLKATEHDDAVLVTEKGITMDTSKIHWIIATTDRGKLFDAFDTRFAKIVLNLYSGQEIAQIVGFNNPDWDEDVCYLVARYCSKIPREALAFAREMRLEHDMIPASWAEVAAKIAEDKDIDEYGMTKQRLIILKALGQGPVAAQRMPIVAGVKPEELNKFVMPWLLEGSDDQPPLVTVTSKGYVITESGVKELNRRRILYKEDVVA